MAHATSRYDPKHGGAVAREKWRPGHAGRRAGSHITTMSTNTSRPDKSDGTDLPECGQTIFERIEEAISGPDAQCGNGPAAVIAYAERQTTADFVEAADALKRMIARGDVVRVDGRLEVVETDGSCETASPGAEAARQTAQDALEQCPEEFDRARELLREALQLMEADR